uniref:Uncharacterized protein n=1 Tax=viral metagenome TaxID=1070528 RepID=A0A6C0LGY4_9ZZZZ
MSKRYKTLFGTVVFPYDSDPRWVHNQYPITQSFAQQALPMGTIIHPSGYAYMNDMNLFKQIRDERDALFEQQRRILHEKQVEEERLRKIEEKKAREEHKQLLKQQKQIQEQLQKLQYNYDREVRRITREVDSIYNPQISQLKKQLNKVNKVLP